MVRVHDYGWLIVYGQGLELDLMFMVMSKGCGLWIRVMVKVCGLR